jgi:hypothetical protein
LLLLVVVVAQQEQSLVRVLLQVYQPMAVVVALADI